MRKVLYTGLTPWYDNLIVGRIYEVIGETQHKLKVKNETGGTSLVRKEKFAPVNDPPIGGKTYGINDIHHALIEHVKDINHQLSLKIGLDHSKEGGQDAATLLLAKSQALESLYSLVSSIEKAHE